MALALFDLDDTLLDGDSATLWFHYMVAHGIAPAAMLAEEEQMMARYYAGELEMADYMAFTLQPLAGMSVDRVDTYCQRFAETIAVPRLFREGIHQLAWHRAQGDELVLISASGAHIVRPIATFFGIPADHVLAIELEQRDGCYTGQTSGILSFREGKVTRLRSWLAAQGRHEQAQYGYSDSINDLPMLRHVRQPRVVNPGAALLHEAQRQQWEVLRWCIRQNEAEPS